MVVLSIQNYIGGNFQAPIVDNKDDNDGGTRSRSLPVTNPATGEVVATVCVSSTADVDAAVHAAATAWPDWSGRTIKARAAVMMKFHALVQEHAEELADLIVKENGKNQTEVCVCVSVCECVCCSVCDASRCRCNV